MSSIFLLETGVFLFRIAWQTLGSVVGTVAVVLFITSFLKNWHKSTLHSLITDKYHQSINIWL